MNQVARKIKLGRAVSLEVAPVVKRKNKKKKPAYQYRRYYRHGFNPWFGNIPQSAVAAAAKSRQSCPLE